MAAEIKNELTKEGLIEIETRLKYLVEVERPENVKAIQEARAQGDLSENADYEAARNQQSAIEAEVLRLEEIIKNHVIIEKTSSGVVALGTTVTIKYQGHDEETFEIVGELQADPFANKISNATPLFKAIQGKKVGDTVEFLTAKDKKHKVKIIDIK